MIRHLKNLRDFIRFFSDEQVCKEYLTSKRWKEGLTCIYCGCSKVYKFCNEQLQCSNCKVRFKITSKTIFERTKLPLSSWFLAIYLYTSHKTSVSSVQVSKHLDISLKSSWFLHHRIMEAFSIHLHSKKPLLGRWQCDEVYIGPLKHRMSRARRKKVIAGTGGIHSIPILGLYHEGGELFGKVLPVGADTGLIQSILRKFIAPKSQLFTDGSHFYSGLNREYDHEIFIHSNGEYARDGNHTAHIEGAFKHFKDTARSTYKRLTAKHMQRYWDEYCFKYNTRHLSDIERFELLFETICRRITYKELIGPNGN